MLLASLIETGVQSSPRFNTTSSDGPCFPFFCLGFDGILPARSSLFCESCAGTYLDSGNIYNLPTLRTILHYYLIWTDLQQACHNILYRSVSSILANDRGYERGRATFNRENVETFTERYATCPAFARAKKTTAKCSPSVIFWKPAPIFFPPRRPFISNRQST